MSDLTTCNCGECGTTRPHASDCAVHNSPAFPKEKCDCGEFSARHRHRYNYAVHLQYDCGCWMNTVVSTGKHGPYCRREEPRNDE